MQLENSPQLWDKLWSRFIVQFPGRKMLERYYRKAIYFSAIDILLQPLSFACEDVLELGSGTGQNSLYLTKKYAIRSVTLVDFSQRVLEKVNEKDFPCELKKVKQDLFLFKPEKEYGLVHSTGLVEHFGGSERFSVIKKHADCAKKGGYIMIWVPVHSLMFSFIGRFNKILGIKEIPLTEKELKTLCAQNSLRVIREHHAVLGALYGVLAQKL